MNGYDSAPAKAYVKALLLFKPGLAIQECMLKSLPCDVNLVYTVPLIFIFILFQWLALAASLLFHLLLKLSFVLFKCFGHGLYDHLGDIVTKSAVSIRDDD